MKKTKDCCDGQIFGKKFHTLNCETGLRAYLLREKRKANIAPAINEKAIAHAIITPANISKIRLPISLTTKLMATAKGIITTIYPAKWLPILNIVPAEEPNKPVTFFSR